MSEPIKQADLFAKGTCECKANMKGKHLWFNMEHHASHRFREYICIRCMKPVYYPSQPFR